MIIELDVETKNAHGNVTYEKISFNLDHINTITQRNDDKANIYCVGNKKPFVTTLSYKYLTEYLSYKKLWERIK